jgi:hypothetical protein
MARAKTKPAPEPGQPATVLPRKLLIVLAATAFALATLLLAGGILWPEKFDHPTARFIVCAAIALNLAVFFFIWYPDRYELTKIPLLDVTVHLTGPIVLYLVLLVAFLRWMPQSSPVAYRFFIPYEGGNRAARISANVEIVPSGADFTSYVVPDRDGRLAGVLVAFERGQDEHRAVFRAPFFEPDVVTFQRGPGPGTFEVRRARP